MDKREEAIRRMNNTKIGVSDEALERVQDAMKVQASKRMLQGKIDAGGADKELLVSAIRRMMSDK